MELSINNESLTGGESVVVEKMKYVGFAGNINDFEEIIEKYVCKYDIQLEMASEEFICIKNTDAFKTSNPYAAIVQVAKKIIDNPHDDNEFDTEISKEKAMKIIEDLGCYYDSVDSRIKELTEDKDKISEQITAFEPFSDLDFNIHKLSQFEFITYRFGRLSVDNFRQFQAFLYDDRDILFLAGRSDKEYIYCVYFVNKNEKTRVDSIFSSLHFERIWLNFDLFGETFKNTPKEAYKLMLVKLQIVELKIKEALGECGISTDGMHAAHKKITDLYCFNEAKKFAVKTPENFFILVGWITESDAERLEDKARFDNKVIITAENDSFAERSLPPTKLKNLSFVKPFERLVKMYGIPSYGEIDSTIFVAITYTIIFGMMFGDVGQGLVLVLLGLYLDNKKGEELGHVLATVGLSSVFFGFMFGSIFGFEGLLPALWFRPHENINSILSLSVIFGVVLIFISMALNMINSFNKRDWSEFLFSPNGISGCVFYAAITYAIVAQIFGYPLPIVLISIFLCISVLITALREPLYKKLKGEKVLFHGSFSMVVFETIVELFEVLLSYFTNTVSFVRIGAFALGHAAMMSVVLLLSATAAGSYNPILIVLGNIFVILMEGVVVAIQVLRLEFYEMFSRFFEGKGKEFVAYRNEKM